VCDDAANARDQHATGGAVVPRLGRLARQAGGNLGAHVCLCCCVLLVHLLLLLLLLLGAWLSWRGVTLLLLLLAPFVAVGCPQAL
jgi:hypothetical protein